MLLADRAVHRRLCRLSVRAAGEVKHGRRLVGPRLAQSLQQPHVERGENGHRRQIHDEEERHDPVGDEVDRVAPQKRRLEPGRLGRSDVDQMVFEVARYGEDNRDDHQHGDDNRGPTDAGQSLGVERATDGDVPVDGQQYDEPRLDEAKHVGARVEGEKGVAVDVVGEENVARRTEEHGEGKNCRVGHGQRLQDCSAENIITDERF